MRRTVPRRSWAVGAMIAIAGLAISQIGAGPLSGPLTKKRSNEGAPRIDESVGDLAYVLQSGDLTVEGVGLVSGLSGTGGDSPPNWQRQQLLDEMSKVGVENPSRLLESRNYAMVIVRMKVPTGASPKDRFDVQLELPPASAAKSLAGGFLMSTRLRQVLIAGGDAKTGSDEAIATGPVMIGTPDRPDDGRIGRVLGGGRPKKERPFRLVLNSDRKFFRNSKMVETVVNGRFHQNVYGQQKGASTAKTDGFLELNVPEVYHQNQERFFRVVQLLPMVDTPELREQRLAATAKELLDPKTSGIAALKLEALGPSASQALEAALVSEDPHVRFFAAEALAYLNESAGVKVLGETAIEFPQYRAYALAALASMEDHSARIQLRKLIDEEDIEVRYGAFNALRTLDPTDASLGQVRILDEPSTGRDDEDASEDSMAMAIISRRTPRVPDPFALYLVETDGPDAVHISRSRRSELVIFGSRQELLTPLVLGQGNILLNAADHDDSVDISRIVSSRSGEQDLLKIQSSLNLGQVVRHVARLGATYPEVVEIIEAAERQKNLPGPLFVDSVPQASMKYLNKVLLGSDELPKTDTAVKPASGSFIRRMFTFRNRKAEADSDADADETGSNTVATAKTDDEGDDSKAPENDATAEKPEADKDLKGAPQSDDAPSVKKDDKILRTSGEVDADGSPRRGRLRMFDSLRRRGE